MGLCRGSNFKILPGVWGEPTKRPNQQASLQLPGVICRAHVASYRHVDLIATLNWVDDMVDVLSQCANLPSHYRDYPPQPPCHVDCHQMRFPEIRGTFLGVRVVGTIVFWSLLESPYSGRKLLCKCTG